MREQGTHARRDKHQRHDRNHAIGHVHVGPIRKEPIFGGIGACLVCACALKAKDGETRYGHVCKDGPVFNAEEVEW